MQPVLLHQGKVRDVFGWGEDLLLVATDRISAFDVVLSTDISSKGIVLTQLSKFWFEKFADLIPHHVISFDLPPELKKTEWQQRTTWCRKAQLIPMECVVRGYLAGSGWKDYEKTGALQGLPLPSGLQQGARLPQPLFTPTTKADKGHDLPLTEAEARKHVGDDLYKELKQKSFQIYQTAHDYALERGIILADTKFEFGWIDGKVRLIDELLTPDSSRFWPADQYQPGKDQPSFDKQYVRDYLLSLPNWNKQPPGPELPQDVVEETRKKYHEAYVRLTGKKLW